jgi:putative hemolysin
MGSSSPHVHLHWIFIAVFCGIVFLVFDAARFFAQQLGPVRLRRLAGDPEDEGHTRWAQYDARNFQLVIGALLQIALIIAIASTVMMFDETSFGISTLATGGIWVAIVFLWKFILALVPEPLSERLLRGLVPFTHFFYLLFWPILFPLRLLLERIERNDEEDDDDEEPTDEEVQAYIDVGEDEGILEPSEGRLLQSIVDFGDRVARELMTPRIDVLSFDARKPLEELARLFSESKYSRIPIYVESIDRITGIVHIKEIFDAILKQEQKPISELARAPYFVSETKKVSELLTEFQIEHLQVAVVVDEFGGTAGIITIEDIVEEIVGEISDEHEDEESTLIDLGDGTWMVSGLLRVDRLEEVLKADLAGEDYETVAGLIFTTLGRVPSVGVVVKKHGVRFEVERADRRRIYRVKVSRDLEWHEGDEEQDENS